MDDLDWVYSIAFDQLIYEAVKGVSDELVALEKFELYSSIVLNTDTNADRSSFLVGFALVIE